MVSKVFGLNESGQYVRFSVSSLTGLVPVTVGFGAWWVDDQEFSADGKVELNNDLDEFSRRWLDLVSRW